MSKTRIEKLKPCRHLWKEALTIPLQLFADDNPGDKGTDNGGNDADPKNKDGGDGNSDKKAPKYSDEDLDRIIGQKLAKWQEKKDAEFNEAKRLAEMSAEEKAAEYEKKYKELNRKLALGDMSKTARKMLSDNGITVDDELLSMLVTDDADKTNAAVKSFTALFNAEVQKAVKAALKGEPMKKGGDNTLTKEQIMAVKNTAERQKLIKENINLFTGGQ